VNLTFLLAYKAGDSSGGLSPTLRMTAVGLGFFEFADFLPLRLRFCAKIHAKANFYKFSFFCFPKTKALI